MSSSSVFFQLARRKVGKFLRNFFVSKLCENGIILERYRQPPLNLFNAFKASNLFLYFLKKTLKTLLPLFVDGVQLSQG